MRIRRLALAACAFAILGPELASAQNGALDPGSLPPPVPSRAGAPVAQQAAVRALATRVAQDATLGAGRFFTVGSDVPWDAVVRRIDNLARERRAVRVRFAAADPGRTLVEGWRGRDGRGVIAAMLARPGGSGTIGYFTVRFAASRE